MFARFLEWLKGDPEKILDNFEDLRVGKRCIQGRIQASTPVVSPVSQIPCAAFYYRSTYLASSRVKASIRRRLRDALSYAEGLSLDLGDGQVELIPKTNGTFTQEEHEALTALQVEGFKFREQRIVPNAVVQVTGPLKQDKGSGQWRMVFQELVPVESNQDAKPSAFENRVSSKKSRKKRQAKNR